MEDMQDLIERLEEDPVLKPALRNAVARATAALRLAAPTGEVARRFSPSLCCCGKKITVPAYGTRHPWCGWLRFSPR